MLATRDFVNEAKYDKQWYTFGPFDPHSGEPDARVRRLRVQR